MKVHALEGLYNFELAAVWNEDPVEDRRLCVHGGGRGPGGLDLLMFIESFRQ